jgi:hypothetical protein
MSSFADGLQKVARRQVTARVVLRVKQTCDSLA